MSADIRFKFTSTSGNKLAFVDIDVAGGCSPAAREGPFDVRSKPTRHAAAVVAQTEGKWRVPSVKRIWVLSSPRARDGGSPRYEVLRDERLYRRGKNIKRGIGRKPHVELAPRRRSARQLEVQVRSVAVNVTV